MELKKIIDRANMEVDNDSEEEAEMVAVELQEEVQEEEEAGPSRRNGRVEDEEYEEEARYQNALLDAPEDSDGEAGWGLPVFDLDDEDYDDEEEEEEEEEVREQFGAAVDEEEEGDIVWFDAVEENFAEFGAAEPLYENAPITVLESRLLLLDLQQRFHLTKAAMDAVCKVLALHLPEDNAAPKDEQELRDYFSGMEEKEVVSHEFCDRCFRLFQGQCHVPDFQEDQCTCGNPRFTQSHLKKAYFLHFPIERELYRRYSDEKFLEAIRYPFTRQKKGEHHLEDILDGTEYQKHPELTTFGNISFVFNTDGVKVFKSGGAQLWPLFMVINELPSGVRFTMKNMILVGLWYHKSKPVFSTFLPPIIRRFKQLKASGTIRSRG